MEEFKSNSHKSKEQQVAKKVTPVVSGTAKTKKKSDIKKFTDLFIAEDASSVGSYILMDVILPTAKRVLEDVVVGSIRILLYGEKGRSSGSKSSASKVSYRSFYERENDRRIDSSSSRTRSGFDYDDIEFDFRGDAEVVLTELENVIEQYHFASVGDLYDLCDITTPNHLVHRYGWKNLASAKVVPVSGGKFVIKLPKAVPLD